MNVVGRGLRAEFHAPEAWSNRRRGSGSNYEKQVSRVGIDSRLNISSLPKCLQSVLEGAAHTTNDKAPCGSFFHRLHSWVRCRSDAARCSHAESWFLLACLIWRNRDRRSRVQNQEGSSDPVCDTACGRNHLVGLSRPFLLVPLVVANAWLD